MEENDIFKEKIQLSNSIKNINKEIFNQRIETKLSLRKRVMDNILYDKRKLGNNLIDNNENKIKWKLLYNNIDNKFISDKQSIEYKLDFNENDNEKVLSLATKYLGSDNIDKIKCGIFLTQTFIKRNMNEDLINSINLKFIYDLFHLIDKRNINQQIDIIFNIFDIIINYSAINTDKTLATILLTPESYKIWEFCFNLQNFDIFYEIITIFNNIIQDNMIGSFNLIRSDFLHNNIFSFFKNENIVSHKNDEDKNNVIYYIIKDGINLFCSLLIIPTDNLDSATKNEVISSKIKIINILLIYYNPNDFENYYKFIFSIEKAVKYDHIIFDELERHNFIEIILINKKFFDQKLLVNLLNKIIGLYVCYKTNINFQLLFEIIKFEANYLDNCRDTSHRKEIFRNLSNILLTNDDIFKTIFEINGFLSNIFKCFKTSYSFSELKEILYLFCVLFQFIDYKYFIELEKNHLMDITFYHAKNICENRVDGLYLCFHIFEYYMTFGSKMSEYFGGKNIIKEKFDKFGGNELLEKYLNFPDENLVKQIISVIKSV